MKSIRSETPVAWIKCDAEQGSGHSENQNLLTLRCAPEDVGRRQDQANASRIGLVRIGERVGSIENQARQVQVREIDCRCVPLREVHRPYESPGDSVLRECLQSNQNVIAVHVFGFRRQRPVPHSL